ncbi:MAG: PAC2 family protein [Chitinivibrionales bacterium]|nr:PAC2 family protein [Chitinivibrionales bacterium]
MRLFDDIKFTKPPTMLAAWPGMGNVGIIAMDYLRTKLDAKVFAEIDMAPFFIPDSIIVKEGIAQLPEIPGSVFYYLQEPSLIIFESNAQVGGREGITIIKTILDLAERFHVKKIFTAAAFAEPISHRNPSRVLAACNNQRLFKELEGNQIEPMPDGYIAGLNGIMLGIAATRQIDSCCFLGTIPSFASNLSYPKASLEIVKMFESLLKITLDHADLEESISIVDKQLEAIEERIREFFPNMDKEEDESSTDVEEEKVPHHIMEKIEQLFEEVRKDKTKAADLKKELDRWKLFELYEHRFLDLFKDENKNRRKK